MGGESKYIDEWKMSITLIHYTATQLEAGSLKRSIK